MSEMRPCEINMFNKIKSECVEVFDIGAGDDLDYYHLHPTAKYHLFEPLTRYKLDELTKGIENIKVIPFGCGDEFGVVMSRVYLHSASINNSRNEGIESSQEIKIIRLDEYIEANNITNFDFIKIDVEGYEYKVLKGLGKYLNKFKFIQIEYGGTYQHMAYDDTRHLLLKDIFDLLSEYKCIKEETMQKYNSYNPSMENYVCCNYLFYKSEYDNII